MQDGKARTIDPVPRRSLKKSQRPAPLKRVITADTTPKASPIGLDQTVEGLEKLDMAASFLQYCASCEKQIMHPSNAMLYCSEACRRKDTNKPLSYSDPAMSPTKSLPSTAPSSPRPILAPRTPTGSERYTDYPSIRIPVELHNAKSDLDPTEWKPKLHRRGDSRNSAAFRYLSQFHRASSAAVEDSEKPYGDRSIASMTSAETPSLTNTPTTATSSLSDYDFVTRPLPPRQNPLYSASAGMIKGVDLVTPHMVPLFVGSVPTVDDPGVWAKKPVAKDATGGKDGLLSKSMGK